MGTALCHMLGERKSVRVLPKENIQSELASHSQNQSVKNGLYWLLPPAFNISLKWQVARTFPGVSCRSAVCPSPGWAGPGAGQNVSTYVGSTAGRGCDSVKAKDCATSQPVLPLSLGLPTLASVAQLKAKDWLWLGGESHARPFPASD